MIKRLMVLFAFLGLLFGGISVSASTARADSNTEDGLCLVTPAKTTYVDHDAVTRYETRWKQDIPAVEEVSHSEYRFYRDVPDVDAVYRTLHTFFRDIPGVDETFTTWYRWKKVESTTVQEYRYKKVVSGSDGIKECKWKKKVEDFKTKYQYQKQVKGVIQKKTMSGWENTGTFDWEWWSGNSTKWSFEDKAVLESGNHSAVQSEWSEGRDQFRKLTQKYQYVKNGVTEQVSDGSHWEYQWATESPGEGWTKTDDCRWMEEPTPDTIVWFPSEDGWTKEVKGDPWVETDSRTVAGPDGTSWFPSEDGWTKEVKESPWTKVAEESRSNEDGVLGYREFKTTEGTTLVESDASEFEESEFPGWELLNARSEKVSDGIPGWREYLAANDKASKNLEDAIWLPVGEVKGWKQLDSKKVVDSEFVPGYTIYFLEGGEPTLTLTDANWTTVEPGEPWVFVDERDFVVKEAWKEKVVTPAKYEKCDELAYTGASDALPYYLGGGALLILLGGALFAGARLRRNN